MKFARRPAARDDASGHPWPKPRILAFQRTRKRRRQAQASTAPPSVLQVLRVIARQRAEIRRHAAAAAIGGAPPDAPALCQLYADARATFSVPALAKNTGLFLLSRSLSTQAGLRSETVVVVCTDFVTTEDSSRILAHVTCLVETYSRRTNNTMAIHEIVHLLNLTT